MLQAVERTSELSNQRIDEILDQMNATYAYANSKLKWYSLELNQALFSQPYIKQNLIGKITKTSSRTTITKYMLQLTELGILSPKTEGREIFYINNDLMRILES
jgi:Fic family protein